MWSFLQRLLIQITFEVFLDCKGSVNDQKLVNVKESDLDVGVCTVGLFSHFGVRVCNCAPVNLLQTVKDTNRNVVWCEVKFDSNHWMCAGPAKKYMLFNSLAQEEEFICDLVPLVSGFVTMPKVILHGVDERYVKFSTRYNRILVLPQTPSVAECYPMILRTLEGVT